MKVKVPNVYDTIKTMLKIKNSVDEETFNKMVQLFFNDEINEKINKEIIRLLSIVAKSTTEIFQKTIFILNDKNIKDNVDFKVFEDIEDFEICFNMGIKPSIDIMNELNNREQNINTLYYKFYFLALLTYKLFNVFYYKKHKITSIMYEKTKGKYQYEELKNLCLNNNLKYEFQTLTRTLNKIQNFIYNIYLLDQKHNIIQKYYDTFKKHENIFNPGYMLTIYKPLNIYTNYFNVYDFCHKLSFLLQNKYNKFNPETDEFYEEEYYEEDDEEKDNK